MVIDRLRGCINNNGIDDDGWIGSIEEMTMISVVRKLTGS
jgi:hypothetical protein